MKGHGTKFGRKKEAAIAALLTHRNIEEAAKAVGISSPTLIACHPHFDLASVRYVVSRRIAAGFALRGH